MGRKRKSEESDSSREKLNNSGGRKSKKGDKDKNAESDEENVRKKKRRKSKGKNEEEENEREIEDSSDEDLMEEMEGGTRIGGIYIPPPPVAVCSLEAKGPRLMISHIVNNNFKSYAGRQVLGPFHKSFTSIIGPNGSGKSNVIDSMLFVFGYRANKIRSKKISVLLHKSENHQHVRSCSVQVHFIQIIDKEGDDFVVVPNSETVVGRTAFADSSSYYSINGKRAHFKDVAQLLRTHGIDLIHNRFLILQGEVETIAMMKPKAITGHDRGMLEFLEDIIGTSRYKRPIEKLGEKVTEASEERQEKVNKLKMVDKDKESLREPMMEAVEFLKIENKKTHTNNKLFQKQIFDHEVSLRGVEEKKKTFDDKMSEIRDNLQNIVDKRMVKEKQHNTYKKEMESLISEKEKLTDNFKALENKAIQLKERISATNKSRKKAIENKKSEEMKLTEFEKIPEKNRMQIEELKVVEGRLKVEIEKEEQAVEKVLASIKVETKELQESKDNLSNKLLGLNNKRDEARSKYEIAKSELDLYTSNQQKESSKLEQMKANMKKTQERIKELSGKVKSLGENIPGGEKEEECLKRELKAGKEEEGRLVEEFFRARASLEESRASAQASKNNQVLNSVMKLKNSGKIPGIYGRLGDLGGIDSKYDVAISTACGLLDHIVVATVDTGKDCIEAMKKNNLGRANFIAVDKQEKFRSQYTVPFHGPEGVPRLFDLITVEDDRVKPAFYFALRDTLVANDLAQAKRVAYGSTRYKVVTLKGEIIEISGTMAGGGTQVIKGKMGSSAVVTEASSPGRVQAVEKRVSELEKRRITLSEKNAQIEERLNTLSKDLKIWKKEVASATAELKGHQSQLPALEQHVIEQEKVAKAAAPDMATLKKKNSAVELLKDTYDEAAKVSSKLEAEVTELNKKIEEATGGKMKEAQNKLDNATKKLDKVVAEMTKLTVAITTSSRNVKKTKDRINALTSDVKEAEESLRNAEAERQKLEADGAGLNEKISNISDKLLELKEEVDVLKKSIAVLIKEENVLKTHKLNEDQNVEALSKKIQEIKSQIPHLKKKLKALKLHEIPDEDGQMVAETLETLSKEELEEINLNQLPYKISQYDERLNNMKPNLRAIQDYKEKSELFKQRSVELDEVTQRRNDFKKTHDEVRKLRLTEFMAGFTIISGKLKEMYQMITLGGDAELELIDSLDPFSEGVIFSVRPPKKSWKNISNLSGGEKTLSSLALVFALHYYRPSPLYVMDEIDAALDFKNVSIVGHYIKERTRNAQFIIISLRPNMFELADLLVGIYKVHNCTKSLTITPGNYGLAGEAKAAEKEKMIQD